MFDRPVLDAMKEHAIREFPRESCGVVYGGGYFPCSNIADDPERDFRIPASELPLEGLQAIVHSHPLGPDHPTKTDMEACERSGVPWGIVVCSETHARDPFWWGPGAPVPPLVGREFRHGVTDCASAILDAFKLGPTEIPDWPHPPILIPDCPREDEWWKMDEYDLYIDNFERAGFAITDDPALKISDVFLMKIRSEKFNHAAVYIGNNLILHHLQGKLSKRDPVGRWGQLLRSGRHLRYKG